MTRNALISTATPKLLYSGNSAEMHRAVKSALAKTCSILFAQNSLSVLELLRAHPDISCILISLRKPYTQGFKTIHLLRTHYKSFHIPIIILTHELNDTDIDLLIEMGADDYLIYPASSRELRRRTMLNLKRSKRDQNMHPLTKLPGADVINKIIEQRITSPLSLLYIDIDHFKPYNDAYGFTRGDNVLKKTAGLITDAVDSSTDTNAFVGHVGGDDFVVITQPKHAEKIAHSLCTQFDATISTFYEPDEIKKGHINVENRQGKMQDFPLITISIGIVTNQHKRLESLVHIGQLAAELKRYAKTKPHGKMRSSYVTDRRLT